MVQSSHLFVAELPGPPTRRWDRAVSAYRTDERGPGMPMDECLAVYTECAVKEAVRCQPAGPGRSRTETACVAGTSRELTADS